MPKPKRSYEAMKTELDDLMLELQQEDIGVDRALECYQRGVELLKEIEDYLKTAENKVTELKAKFSEDR